MATAEVPIERDGNASQQREILSRCFSEARRRLDERERQLSLQLEQKLGENRIHKNNLNTDQLQLELTTEQIKANLSSNSLQETGTEAISVFEQRISKLKDEERIVQFEWSPKQLYSEISKIGEVTLLPAFPQVDSDSNNCKRIKLEIVPSFQEQKQEIHSLLSQALVKGQEWYLVHIRWFKQWKRYVGYDNRYKSKEGDETIKPGPIDTAPLLDNGKLRRHLVHEIDYKLVPDSAWYKLISWYGISVASDGIKRKVLELGKYNKQCKVEIYPLELNACVYPDENEFKIVRLSRGGTIHTLDRKIRKSYNIGPDKRTRIYSREMILHTYELMEDMNKEAQDEGLLDAQCVMLEVRSANGTWPRMATTNIFSNSLFT